MDCDDMEFIQAMRRHDEQYDKTATGLQYIARIVSICCVVADVSSMKRLYSDDVDAVVDFINTRCIKDSGKTDILAAMRLSLAAAYRFTHASVDALERTWNPKSGTDPDDPMIV